jgi:signal transduction histidine kinase/CheY-like chemotaxis protein
MTTIGFSLSIKRGQERAVNEALYSTNQKLEFHQAELELRTAELAKANAAANAANTAKSEFLSSMSHELRTPLHAIIGFSELLLNSKNTGLSEKHKNQITQINKAGEYLFYLINEILEFTKIEAGVILVNTETVNLRSLLDDCIELSGPVMAKYGVTLTDETASALPLVRIDPVRGQQIFLNLLSNAAKYNTMGGNVRVTCSKLNERFVRINVIDTGKGIDESKMSELFVPFNRLGAELTVIEGSGIGLALVRKLVDMMGGGVSCTSSIGKGSTFSVDLPLVEDQNLQVENAPIPQVEATIPVVRDITARFLLYIEDNPANVSLMQDFIAIFEGWDIEVASNAEDGIRLARRRSFDLIICDINLPGMNGLEAIKHLKQTGPNASVTPILALSADATPNTIQLGKDAGFTDYLTKPIRLRELESIMITLFNPGKL